jgi:DNA-binding transcriptional LysR family regulator
MFKRSELMLLRAMHQHPTVTAAAASVNMSQPAASAMLRAMEDRLGFELFTRERRRLALTSHGRALLPEVMNAIAGLEAVDRLARDLHKGSTTRLVVGAVSIAASSIVPESLEEVRRRHPAISATLRVGTTLDLTEMAAEQRIDIGLIIGTATDDRVASRHLGQLNLCCVMRSDHPFAKRKTLTLADVAAGEFIALSPHLPAGRATVRELAIAGIDRMPSVEAMQSSASCALVWAGAGIAIVETLGALYGQRQGLVARTLVRVNDLGLTLVWSRNKGMTPPANDLAQSLAARAAHLVNELE